MNANFLEEVILLSQRTILSKLVELYGDKDQDINIDLLEYRFLKRPNIHLSNNQESNIVENVVKEEKKRKRGRPRKNKEPEKKVLKIVVN